MSALTILLSISLHLINPVEDSLRSYIQRKYPELCVTQRYHFDEVDFFQVQNEGSTYVGASVSFRGTQPEMYAVLVLTEQKDVHLNESIELFEQKIDETKLKCYQIGTISNENGKKALVIIWER